jgi:hypothetical protein
MELDFEWRDARGIVRVDCHANDDPEGLGCFSGASGLPVCTATVEFPHLGYRSMTGWVQLVRSTDNESAGAGFECDPFVLFGDAPSPYCWYANPTLFDGPSRSTRDDMAWEAHSFLCTTPPRRGHGTPTAAGGAAGRVRVGIRHHGPASRAAPGSLVAARGMERSH